jgi:centromere protein C
MYQKVFGEDQFIAAGVVFIPVGGKKPGKHSKDNSYVRRLSCRFRCDADD